jgi:hypothetical protein
MTEQNERHHGGFTVSKLIEDVLEHLGIVLVAEAGHGKSYTAFTIVKEAMKRNDITVIVFSPSTIWRRNFGSIACVKVGTSSFNPIIENENVKLEPIPIMRDSIFINLDKKWTYVQSAWLEQLLDSKKHLLFEIKYRNGRRIKAFEGMILQRIYEMQERQLENSEYKHHYLIVLEEVQNAFGTYSMNSDDSLELFTIFTQSRSDANIHYVAIGQRLNDISTKVIERLRPLVGMTLGENSLRKIKAMIPEGLRPRIQQLPKRHWLYLDGKENPEIVIPLFMKEGKPTILKPKIPQPQKRKSLAKRLSEWFNRKTKPRPVTTEELENLEDEEDESEEDRDESEEDRDEREDEENEDNERIDEEFFF